MSKIGNYVIHYRKQKKEAAQRQKEEREDLARRQPQIIDPSFEILGYTSPDAALHDPFNEFARTSNVARRSSVMPPLRYPPTCDLTPKSSVGSTTSSISTGSELRPTRSYDMSWGETVKQPEPQIRLPPAPVSKSDDMPVLAPALNRRSTFEYGTSYEHFELNDPITRPASMPPPHTDPPSIDVIPLPTVKTSSKVSATLSTPWSMDDPFGGFGPDSTPTSAVDPKPTQDLFAKALEELGANPGLARSHGLTTIDEGSDTSEERKQGEVTQ